MTKNVSVETKMRLLEIIWNIFFQRINSYLWNLIWKKKTIFSPLDTRWYGMSDIVQKDSDFEVTRDKNNHCPQ